jgi:cation diffusion facilitator CzcD-associated flavoprotein CzcO
MPFYSLDIPEVWESWTWSERFPGFAELQEYFEHAAKVLDLKKDIEFNTEVVSAEYQQQTGRWVVKTRDGRTATCTYLVNCVGTSFARYVPPFPKLNEYKGLVCHSSYWPTEGVDVKGKNVAVIGTGATGLQICQEWGKQAGELTVYLRTPNFALPMYQRKLTEVEQTTSKGVYQVLFDRCRTTRSGLPYARAPNKTFDNTPEEQQAYLKKIWARGGFNFTQGERSDNLQDWLIIF